MQHITIKPMTISPEDVARRYANEVNALKIVAAAIMLAVLYGTYGALAYGQHLADLAKV